ncbi:MAG TPA: STAS domain-containing protein [Gemmataceae bacterium]|nr:STAS domain-containing protein [Gemmataceae bacterium]
MASQGDITIVYLKKFLPVLDGENLQTLGEQLFDLVDNQGKRKVLLNFEGVVFVSSAALGKLITLNKKIQKAGGKLVMCAIAEPILEVFEVVKLDRLVSICPDQPSGLAVLQAAT